MKFPHALFKRAGFNSTDVAAIFGVSRVTGARWLSGVDRNGNPGVGVNVFLQDRVERIAAAVEAAVAGKNLPDPTLAKLPPEQRVKKLKTLIRQFKP